MKKTWLVLPLLLLIFGPAALGQEHQFGLRVGNTVFGDADSSPAMSVEEELLSLNYVPAGCRVGPLNPPGCPDVVLNSENTPLSRAVAAPASISATSPPRASRRCSTACSTVLDASPRRSETET